MPDEPDRAAPRRAERPERRRRRTGCGRRAAAARRAARSSVGVLLLAVLGFAAVTQVRANEVDDTYAGCASRT